jgi:hypothetical protein
VKDSDKESLMYLRVQGGPFSDNLVREIQTLTDSSTVYPGEERYDKESGVFSLPIIRYPIIGKRKFFGSFTPYRRDKTKPISTLLTVRNVTDCNVHIFDPDYKLISVTLIFGVTIRGNHVIINSAQEHRGHIYYIVSLTTKDLDLELKDIDEAKNPEPAAPPDRR